MSKNIHALKIILKDYMYIDNPYAFVTAPNDQTVEHVNFVL